MTSLPQVDYKKEVRFAVVMYGGVSLAVYINGVSQELLKLVRATATAGSGAGDRPALSGAATAPLSSSLIGTERVYRKVSHLLSDEELLSEYRVLADEAGQDDKKRETVRERLNELISDDSIPIRTGFIVDILSGTSAGGINSIYLAKALANEQKIDRLKQLWINEGDIELLLNDSDSLKGIGLDAQDPPQSLLNSRRMYLKLLRALDDMDRDNPAVEKHVSPYTSELDLFITATDIDGVPVPLKLSDKIVYERRHRNVFHFEYKQNGLNDFQSATNPFLAFAARCTSSFPFAFEPMRLSDIDELLQRLPDYCDRVECRSDSESWRRYFREILDPRTGVPNLRYSRRAFGDGGYLDNKPFSYAIEALVRRDSDVPVDRRLIYIEPSPEHPEDVPDRDYKPDALSNVKAALLDLPAHETIREDLQRVLQRNLLIDRVHRITAGIEKDINRLLPRELKAKLDDFSARLAEQRNPDNENRRTWSDKNLEMMVKEKGRAYLSYQKLRIAAVTDDLARLMARLLNFDANSDLLLSLRCLVRAWREANYFDYEEPTLNQFLSDYDFSHRVRRLTFIREKVDALYDYTPSLQLELAAFRKKYVEVAKQIADSNLNENKIKQFRNENPDIGWLLGLLRSGAGLADLDTAQRKALRAALLFMKCEVNKVYKDFQAKGRILRQRNNQLRQNGTSPTDNPILESFKAIGLKAKHLNYIIDMRNVEALTGRSPGDGTGTPNEDEANLLAEELLKENSGDKELAGRLQKATTDLKKAVAKTVIASRERMKLLLDPDEPIKADTERGKRFLAKEVKEPLTWLNSSIVRSVREYLAYYYHNFEEYDQIAFPIFYEADVGEASIVEVIRVSPADATSLINERDEKRRSADGKGRQKLAGVALHNFGAFLDRTWRQNDIMWGRLDGAERLISSLLPGPRNDNLRALLIEEAHSSILIDELPPESRLQLGGIVSEALLRASAGEPMEKAVAKVTAKLNKDVPVRTKLEAVIRGTMDNNELLEFIRTGYEVNRQLDPKPLLTSISRATQIIGKVFEDIANANQIDGKSLAWIARLGQLFWGLVAIAVPNTIRNMLFEHWLYVIYAFEFFTIIAGLLLSSQRAQQFGWTALGITVVINVLVLVLKDIMRGRRAVFKATAGLVCLTILGLAALGLLEILGPIFNVKVSTNNLYPMYWLKETAKQRLPTEGWFGRNFFLLVTLSGVAVLLLLLNRFFGVVDFSWLDRRWQLFTKWIRQSSVRRWWPWGRFKPVRLFADGIENKARRLPGKEGLYLLPFSLSTIPPREWASRLESHFMDQQHGRPNKQQLAVTNKEVVVVCSSDELGCVFQRLSASAADANKEYQAELQKQAVDDYKDQKRLIERSEQPLFSEGPALPPALKTQLEALSIAAANKVRKWSRIGTRVVGLLAIVMGLLIILNLFGNYRRTEVKLPGDFYSPGLALELARTPEEASEIIRSQGAPAGEVQRESIMQSGQTRLRRHIELDWLAIFYYLITLSLICYGLARGRQRQQTRLAMLAGISVFVAAIFDVLENNNMLTLLGENPITTETVNATFWAATVKWAALFFNLALIGLLLWQRRKRVFGVVATPLFLTAVVGAIGLLGYRAGVEWAFFLMALSMIAVGVLFLLAPKKLEMKLR